MFAHIIAGNRNNAGKTDVGRGSDREGAIPATGNVS